MPTKLALIVVDMQNDFCLPTGSLSVQNALDLVPLINRFIQSPHFSFKVATKDWHPQSHISFAPNHPAPDNKPFESYITVSNHVANKPSETMQQRLWPVHCVQNTSGAQLIDTLDTSAIDLVVEKGTDERVEMYSAFCDSFGNLTEGEGGVSFDLAKVLREKGVEEVCVVGVAGDYCVNFTALDAAKAGFRTFVVAEGTNCVVPEAWSTSVKEGFEKAGVEIATVNDEKVKKLLDY